jgi:hypothetical protein
LGGHIFFSVAVAAGVNTADAGESSLLVVKSCEVSGQQVTIQADSVPAYINAKKKRHAGQGDHSLVMNVTATE